MAHDPFIRSIFEPSVPRTPLAVWSMSDGAATLDRLLTGLAQFLADTDVRQVDAVLFQRGSQSGPPTLIGIPCRYGIRNRGHAIDRITFQCSDSGEPSENRVSIDGALYIEAGGVVSGAVDHLSFGDDELHDLAVAGDLSKRDRRLRIGLRVIQRTTGLHARLGDGNAVHGIHFELNTPDRTNSPPESREKPVHGSARIGILHDFEAIQAAIDALARAAQTGESDALARKPFRRARIMTDLSERLHMPALAWCCLDDRVMPKPVSDAVEDHGAPGNGGGESVPAIASFRRYCGRCHQGEEPFPPNFLHGTPARVQEQIGRCADRILFRLEMWRLQASARPETPMPPVSALRRLNLSPEQWSSHGDLSVLTNYAADLVKARTGAAPRLDDLIAHGYDNLIDCLPGDPADLLDSGSRRETEPAQR
jgi:hypothetical protein